MTIMLKVLVEKVGKMHELIRSSSRGGNCESQMEMLKIKIEI